MTRAKFSCMSVEKQVDYRDRQKSASEQGFTYTVKLQAVYSNSEENKTFWEATPSGRIELTCIHSDLFVPGADYYVDFTPAPDAGGAKE